MNLTPSSWGSRLYIRKLCPPGRIFSFGAGDRSGEERGETLAKLIVLWADVGEAYCHRVHYSWALLPWPSRHILGAGRFPSSFETPLALHGKLHRAESPGSSRALRSKIRNLWHSSLHVLSFLWKDWRQGVQARSLPKSARWHAHRPAMR